jgi:hypothetical protein
MHSRNILQTEGLHSILLRKANEKKLRFDLDYHWDFIDHLVPTHHLCTISNLLDGSINSAQRIGLTVYPCIRFKLQNSLGINIFIIFPVTGNSITTTI